MVRYYSMVGMSRCVYPYAAVKAAFRLVISPRSFLIMLGIPLSYSIGDGLALGFIAYPVIKLLSGRGGEVKWLTSVLAVVLFIYFVLIRSRVGGG